jgi:lysophospholipase L1-like esterase
MVRNGYVTGALALALTAIAACSDKKDVVAPPTGSGGALFESYVAMGNSITAGYQSSGINAATQAQSYAALIAAQAGTRYAYAKLFGPRGCAPPIVDFATGAGAGGVSAAARPTTCDLRDPASATSRLNNVAVPNAHVADPATDFTPNSNILTQLILGGKTQVEKAIETNPTFVSIWIGNNDALSAAGSGILTAVAGVSDGLTPAPTFITLYDDMLTALQQGAPRLQGGILVGVVQVTGIPLLFPADSLAKNATFQAEFRVATGGGATTPSDLTVHPNCTNSTSLVSFAIVPQIRLYRATGGASGHPPLISCGVTPAAPAPVGDVFILDAAEQATLQTTIATYNTHIQQKATELGWAYADPNTLLASLRALGDAGIPAKPILSNPAAPFGPYISLDGLHPNAAAHKLIANALIAAINAKYTLSIPAVP